MSPEEREKMRTLFKSMTPEQRKRYKDLSIEEKKEMLKQIMRRQQ